MLTTSGLTVYFYSRQGIVKAIDGVDLGIKPNSITGLVGESGSGKSTLGLSIMRLLPPQGRIVGGSILFEGKDLTKLSEPEMRRIRGAKLSMVFQDPLSFLNPVMKIGDQIIEAIVYSGESKPQDAEEKAEQLLERLSIPRSRHILDDYPHQLSGGMRQRVLMAIATVSNPSLLIADEPTTALDVTVQAQILEEIKSLAQRTGSSVLLITHDLGIVAETCHEVYVMYAGRIAERGNVETLFEAPLHPYTLALLDSALSIEEFKEKLVGIGGEVPNLVTPAPGCRFHPRCPKAMPICREREPKPFHASKDHTVYCWLHEGN
jgi:oligopeptide/dipeptide ABC transporter ATP-binding protein